jgi:hypothetical membrane protein
METRADATRLVGVLAPALFVASFLVQGFRADYDPWSQFVSELSIGPFGWVQMATFILTGAGFVAFGILLRRHWQVSRVGAACLVVVGACLAASGPFVTDPSAMFEQKSAAGTVHGLLGAVVFTLFPVICFVFVRDLRRRGHQRFARLTVIAGVLLVLGIILLKVSELAEGVLFDEKGLVQRVVLVLFMAWSAVLAVVRTRNAGA